MKDELLERANALKIKISAANKILNDTLHQLTDVVTFSSTSVTTSSSSVVCTDVNIIENIRTLLIKVHEDNLKVLVDEFEAL